LVLVMAYELGRDVLRASQLVGELQASDAGLRENEERMSLAVDAANFGIWIRTSRGTRSGRATSGGSCSALRRPSG